MIRCMLPLSEIDPEQAERKPCMFVDTGVSVLLDSLDALGASRQDLVAKVAGAGSLLGREDGFRTGLRNYTVLRKVLWMNDIPISNEDTGGPGARTLYLDISDGRTTVESEGKEVEL
jgi:chemotaxis protein CheD